jgi:hypothetical protein
MGLARFQKPDSNERLSLPDKLIFGSMKKKSGPVRLIRPMGYPVSRVLSSTYTHE